MRFPITCLLALLVSLPLLAQRQPTKAPVNLIFDTDIGPDYDDVGAMAILHTLADSGRVNILATVASNQSPYIAGVLDVINTYCKRPNLPIGVVRGRAVNLTASQKWDSVLVARYPHDLVSNAQADDALTLYRRLLAEQPNGSVTICTVGFLTNMANLLDSKPDRYSPLSGRELVRKKVKRLVSMAGWFPNGKEFNVDRDPVSSQRVFNDWPTDIYLSGFEIGHVIHTGLPLVQNTALQQSPIKDAFAISIPLSKQDAGGRMSWDETAVLAAVNGYEPYFELVPGRLVCAKDGSNTWNAAGKGHFYFVQKMPIPQLERELNRLMMR